MISWKLFWFVIGHAFLQQTLFSPFNCSSEWSGCFCMCLGPTEDLSSKCCMLLTAVIAYGLASVLQDKVKNKGSSPKKWKLASWARGYSVDAVQVYHQEKRVRRPTRNARTLGPMLLSSLTQCAEHCPSVLRKSTCLLYLSKMMVKVCKIMLSVSSLEAVWTLAVPLLLYDTASVPHWLHSSGLGWGLKAFLIV